MSAFETKRPADGSTAGRGHRSATRALDATAAYWLAMFAASAFGTNLGDLWLDDLSLRRLTSFGSLVAICAVAIWGDNRLSRRTEALYWTAVVALRAATTNLADFLTHDLRLSYVVVTVALTVLTLLAGYTTRPAAKGSPLIDRRYWLAMLLAGLVGTVGGDLAAHTYGLYPAALALSALLLVVLLIRARYFPAVMLIYWCAILTERTAATPVGDALASKRALGLGLPLATSITASLFVMALLLRRALRRRAIESVRA
jgi:uncharacterized membrane-anchored protein